MKLRKTIDRVADRYHVITEIAGTSAAEEQLIADHGEPVIEVGGSFSGNITRPGETAPIVTVAGGLGATASAIVVDGEITSYVVSAPGSGYLSIPAVSITGGGGSGATATATLKAVNVAVANGGSGYIINDEIVLDGGTFLTPTTVKVAAVTLGVVTSVMIVTAGNYSSIPSNPVAQDSTDGSGVGAEFTVTWGVNTILPDDVGADYFTVPTSVSFTFPTKQRRLLTDFPDKRVFDLADDEDADLMAKLYSDAIEARIVTAVTELRAKTNPFEGETLITI